MSNTRWSVPMSGFAFLSRTMSLENPIIISLSHSGQTFPTLHATHTFRKLCGDRVFVVTGSWTRKWVRLLVSWVMQGRPGLRAHGLRLQVVITHMQKSQICAHSAHTCMLNVAFDVTVSSFRVSGYLLCVPFGHCMYTQDGDLLRFWQICQQYYCTFSLFLFLFRYIM